MVGFYHEKVSYCTHTPIYADYYLVALHGQGFFLDLFDHHVSQSGVYHCDCIPYVGEHRNVCFCPVFGDHSVVYLSDMDRDLCACSGYCLEKKLNFVDNY